MAEDKKPGAAVVLKKYFELLPGQKMIDFMEELKQLTPEDKAQLAAGIEDGTLTYA